jgi:hypothetical protein
MSDTPRTLALDIKLDGEVMYLYKYSQMRNLARELERELTAAKEYCVHCENEATDAAADARRSNSLLRECLVVMDEMMTTPLCEIEALAQRVRDYLEDEV